MTNPTENALAAVQLAAEMLNEARAELERLRTEPPTPPPPKPSVPIRQRRSHRKRPPTSLRIAVDGRLFTDQHAATAFVDAIGHLGFGRIARLGLRLGRQQLIVDRHRPEGRGYHQRGSTWIATHSDTAEKAKLIREICRRLGLPCSVEIVDRYPRLVA